MYIFFGPLGFSGVFAMKGTGAMTVPFIDALKVRNKEKEGREGRREGRKEGGSEEGSGEGMEELLMKITEIRKCKVYIGEVER